MTGILNALIAGVSGAVKDTYFNLVSLLLPGNGTNGAQNNTFLDSSTNNFTITRNGDTTQGTFSPFSQTGWGGNFNGTSFIQAPDNATMQVGTSDFTIEMWAYFTSDFSGSKWLGGKGDQSTAAGTAFSFYSSAFEVYSGSTSYSLTCPTWSSNRWYHIAIVKSGTSTNNLKLYIDGSVQSQASIGSNSVNSASGNGLKIGAYSSAGVASYISNFRFVKGRAVYTSTFTPPTSPLGVTSGGQNPPQGTETSLLVLQSNRFVDVANNYTLTLSSNPSVTPFSPFAPTSSYSAAAVGGSGYFDGSGDFLEAGTTSSFNFMHNTTATFTFQGWIYPLALPGSGSISTLFSTIKDSSSVGVVIYLAYSSSSVAALGVSIYRGVGGSPVIDNPGTALIRANTWQHVAVTYDQSLGSANAKFYIDGVAAGTATKTANTPSSSNSTYVGNIGRIPDPTAFTFNGYISNLRIDNSVQTISVPTAPLSTISGTQLLLNFTNAGVVDATAKNVLETVGNAQISTTQSKWGGGSISFDGTGDYLKVPDDVNWDLGSSNFTIEAWVYPTASPLQPILIGQWTSSYAWLLTLSNDSNRYLRGILYNGSFNDYVSTSPLQLNSWNHCAMVRESNTVSLYLNGSRVYTTTFTGSVSTSTSAVTVGANASGADPFTGYMDDVRITKGLARYTGSTYTTPTAPFPVQ